MKSLLKIIKFQHFDENGKIICEKKDLHNMIHNGGEDWILGCLFIDQTQIPTNYYFGLDARGTIAAGDTLSTINGLEPPNGSGYSRFSVPSSGQFASSETGQVMGPVLTFGAGSSYSSFTIYNLFLATSNGNSGILICSVPLGIITINGGQRISMQMSLTLGAC